MLRVIGTISRACLKNPYICQNAHKPLFVSSKILAW